MTKLLPSLLFCSLASTAVYADTTSASYGKTASTEKGAGLFSGVVIGTLAGGPPGAIVGGALGALFGDGISARKELRNAKVTLAENSLELKKAQAAAAKSNQLYLAAQKELARLSSQAAIQNVAHSYSAPVNCCGGTSMSVHFRSGSNILETHYQKQLAGISKIAQAIPGTRLEIVGYADRNGDADANLKLSKQRTDAVRVFFNTLGISNSMITTIAYGETKPVDQAQSLESDFFDRKVTVSLRDANNQLVTKETSDQ